jgi:hypothetical protein
VVLLQIPSKDIMTGSTMSVRILNTFLHFETSTEVEEKRQSGRAKSSPPAFKNCSPGDAEAHPATRLWASDGAKDVVRPVPPLPGFDGSRIHTAEESTSNQAVKMTGTSKTDMAEQGPISLVLKNIPARCTLGDMVLTIANSGFQGKFDYMYMPMKRNALQNKGYVFVSFPDGKWAQEFCNKLGGRTSCGRRSAKVIEIERSDVNLPIQQIQTMGHALPPSPYGPLFAGCSKSRGSIV